METRLKTFINLNHNEALIDLFGYSTHGLPGVEICGLGGSLGRIVKEKIIFLTKISTLKLPLKRFVLCVEQKNLQTSWKPTQHIELPLLILFWTLTGHLKIRNLEECVTSGCITVAGEIVPDLLTEERIRLLKSSELVSYKWIGSGHRDLPCLQLHEIMQSIPRIRTVFPPP